MKISNLNNQNFDALKNLGEIKHFLPKQQAVVLIQSLHSNEVEVQEWARNVITSIAYTVNNMPKVYETDGEGDEAIAHLHYFSSGSDFFITEKDIDPQQFQAFGLANCGEPELGYISITELIQSGIVELDFYWQSKPLKSIKAELRA